MTLEDAVALALQQHPRVAIARHRTEAAEAQVGVAKSSYYPRVDAWLQAIRGTANGSLTVYHSPPGTPRIGGRRPDGLDANASLNNFLAAATVHQLLYDFGRTQGDVGAQKALVEGAKMNEKLVKQSVIFEVTRAYYQVLARKEGVRVADDGVQLTQRVLEMAETGERAGLRPPSDSARAEADVAAAELALIQARGELDVALAQFVNALGGAEGRLEPVSEVPEKRVPTEATEALAIALRERYEPRALDFQEQALKQRLRSTRAEHYPRIDALASVNTRGQFWNPSYEDFAVNNWNVGVRLQVPIFEGMRVTEQTRAIEAELHALHSSRDSVRQTIELEVKQALVQLRSAEEAVRAASKGVEATKVALDTTVGRYRSGLANIVEITDAQTAYISANSAAQRAAYDLRLARARLRFALGTLGTTDAE